jgi:hypothetical protein
LSIQTSFIASYFQINSNHISNKIILYCVYTLVTIYWSFPKKYIEIIDNYWQLLINNISQSIKHIYIRNAMLYFCKICKFTINWFQIINQLPFLSTHIIQFIFLYSFSPSKPTYKIIMANTIITDTMMSYKYINSIVLN